MSVRNASRQALFALGFLSIGTQLYLVRETMSVFGGVELILGMVLAQWMVLTGLGAFLAGRFPGRHSTSRVTVILLLAAGMLPPLMIPALGFLRALIVPFGSMADLGHIFISCLLIQLPFCLLNGALFIRLSTLPGGMSPSSAYSWESLGSMAAGIFVNLALMAGLTLIPGMSSFLSVILVCCIYFLLSTGFVLLFAGKKGLVTFLIVSFSWAAFAGMTDLRSKAMALLYTGQKICNVAETPYGQIVVTSAGGQFSFYSNGSLLFSSGNEIGNEENVHYAMVQLPAPRNVLLVSGGYAGTLGEILKYRPSRVDYVELDPALVSIAQRYTKLPANPAVTVHNTDARQFIRTCKASYDVVLMNIPEPSSLQLNRYYSLEFLHEVRLKMNPGAVIAYSLPTGSDYVSRESGLLNSAILGTLRQCFRNVLIIPGNRNYFLASEGALSSDIPGLIQKRGIETVFVNSGYLDTGQIRERSARVMSLSESSTLTGSLNRDFFPVAVWSQLSWWLSRFHLNHLPVLLAFLAVFVLLVLSLNPVNAGLFSGGFTLAASEMILVFGLQVISGNLFITVAALIMVFMLGLAAGAGSGHKTRQPFNPRRYRILQILLGLLALLTPPALAWLGHIMIAGWLSIGIIALTGFVLAFIGGLEYREASLFRGGSAGKVIAANYSAELFGSALGAFSVALFLIPAAGIFLTGALLALLNLLSTAASLRLK